MRSVTPTKEFLRNLKKLPPDRQKGVKDAIQKFLTDPIAESLRFRPLRGTDGHFIINARRGDRIILRAGEGQLFVLADVGPHDNTYRRWDR